MTTYNQRARAQAADLAAQGRATLLAIESSCDETSVAVVKNGQQVLSCATSSQIAVHQAYGGVVPEIASRKHMEAVNALTDLALEQAGLRLSDVDAIAVTHGPGLVGALLVGVSFAKGLALAADKPLVAVHHIEGHIAANYITHPTLQPPYLCLVVSGGHTLLCEVLDHGRYRLLGSTRDDAAGEAFDKGARLMGLPYPGGKMMDEAAKGGDDRAFDFPQAKVREAPLDMSFSGLKTSVLQRLAKVEEAEIARMLPDLAASYQRAIVDVLVDRTVLAAQARSYDTVTVAGGVSANSVLRQSLRQALEACGKRLLVPELSLCTDNAAMIGAAGYFELMQGRVAGMDLNAHPSLPLPFYA